MGNEIRIKSIWRHILLGISVISLTLSTLSLCTYIVTFFQPSVESILLERALRLTINTMFASVAALFLAAILEARFISGFRTGSLSKSEKNIWVAICFFAAANFLFLKNHLEAVTLMHGEWVSGGIFERPVVVTETEAIKKCWYGIRVSSIMQFCFWTALIYFLVRGIRLLGKDFKPEK